MTTALDARLVPKVLSIIERLGTNAVFHVPSAVDRYDRATGKSDQSPPEDVTRKVSPPGFFSRRMVDGDTIRQDDFEVFLPASGLAWSPSIGMHVTVAGGRHAVTFKEPIYSGDDIAVWRLGIRK